LGETRGGEASDLLQLLNSRHSGTISTLHANSALLGISRFASCVMQSGVEIPYLATKTNIADSLNVIVQIERRPGIRFVSRVLQIRGFDIESETYQFESVYSRKDRVRVKLCRIQE
jgi:pilus assembly protein CpaF